MSLEELSDTNNILLLAPESQHLEAGHPGRHKRYYFEEDIMAIFLVGDQRFRVHRYHLRKESEVFNWMFACPPGADNPDGCSDERAIPLPGVTPAEFEALLDFFYEEKFQRNAASTREWINLLAISTRYDFQRIRERAIDALEHNRYGCGPKGEVDPIEQIGLAEKHDIPRWLRIAYVKICERSDPLDESEAEKIGARKTALLARAREAVRNPHHRTPSPPPARTPPSPLYSPPLPIMTAPGSPRFPSNGFYHNRHRVDAVVSEVFFPSEND
ncbi:hypothetical protein K438DRAFT_1722310 [Mycena galopus ATCC 62051]|nr:hypothetical protein K438DRAFT_1722310 [Mycena galopus ATCC 62051]